MLNGDLPNNYSTNYLRGAPSFGMDLITNPFGASEWLHSDILYAHRNSLADTFSTWLLSNMARNFYSEGAPTPTFLSDDSTIEFMAFTSNDNSTNNSDIWIINNTVYNPSGLGSPMPAPVNTSYNEDNPQIVRLDTNNLVLFFDSDNLPNGLGNIDIWFSQSSDNGITWSVPANVTTINTPNKEHQPFLHKELLSGIWYLYYATPNTDGKLAIFRAPQTTDNNWNSWGAPELVISAGNSAGVGEPTVTDNGDISFVVVYVDPQANSIYNHYDSDPWYLRKKTITTGINNVNQQQSTTIYPNPSNEEITVNAEQQIQQIKIYNNMGKLILVTKNKTISINQFSKGIYYLNIQFKSGKIEQKRVIKY